jgi:hypothetical protein
MISVGCDPERTPDENHARVTSSQSRVIPDDIVPEAIPPASKKPFFVGIAPFGMSLHSGWRCVQM